MITTVTMNPAIDKSIIVDSISLGKVNRVKEVVNTIGGKGINVSKVLNYFKVDNIATGILGDTNSNLFKSTLEEYGIKHSFIEVPGATRTNIKITETDVKKTTDINEPGLYINDESIKTITNNIVELSKKSSHVVISGSLPPCINENYYALLISKIKSHTITVLDTNQKNLLEGIRSGVDIIKPNKEELEQAYKMKLENKKECIIFCQKIIQNNKLSTVLLTLGNEGALHITANKALYCKAVTVNVNNTVGAGDFFLGAYISGKSKGLNDHDCFINAIAAATCAVIQKDTSIFTKKEFDSIQKLIKIEDCTIM